MAELAMTPGFSCGSVMVAFVAIAALPQNSSLIISSPVRVEAPGMQKMWNCCARSVIIKRKLSCLRRQAAKRERVITGYVEILHF